MSTFAFSGGIDAASAYGQKDKFRFVGTWVAGEIWSAAVTAVLSGNFTIGVGNISNKSATCGIKLRNRMYLGIGDAFALSSNNEVTKWEEQDSGAARVSYVSQFGQQDSVVGFGVLQGRLAVIGTQSIQIWGIDADPANLTLQQTLDNTGARSMLSIKSIGDLDVLYLDSSGFRSVRANQLYLNATLEDIGTAIDLLVRTALVGIDASGACGIVEPTTKQYWCYLSGNIYVLSNYPTSKITAWSIYKATTEVAVTPSAGVYTTVVGGIYYWTKNAGGTSLTCGTTVLTASGGFVATSTSATEVGTPGTVIRVDTAFTPEKFVVYNRQIYARATNGKIYRYGGSDNNTFDHCRATVELPWLDMQSPATKKVAIGIEAAFSGNWAIQASMNPRTTTLTEVVNRGSTTTPSMVDDSTFELGHFGFTANGTHVKLKAISGIVNTAAKLGKLTFLYNIANVT